ncbi:MAG: photosystem stability/assembly factor-like protein, partial [Acidobacteria bacterium]|nr:photosystem stability/assembly factor-like protein [Acidobacteriota bacterium]
GDVGRIGLAISQTNPDLVYATIEAEGDGSGFYRTLDAGATWEKRSPTMAGGPQYYQEIFVDPNNDQRVYMVDVFMLVTEDGGKTFRRAGEKDKHVDNHALWIDPADSDHLVNGCDGGVYESWDRATTWQYKANLPITQFYKLGLDNDAPFYNVYGGTQDNATQGGPSRTQAASGIANSDWFVTLGGDGFKPAIDPTNPAIVYSQYQHGELYRFDRKTGERVEIQPQAMPGEDPSRWNWDSPLIISPHAPTRLYFASQRVYRSDDRGDNWRAISGDLTRQIDRNQLPVMGRVYGVDAVAKNNSTSFYGNIVALAESPKAQGLLYAGTDDGLIQVTDDAGGSWRKIESFPGVPDRSYVSDIEASPFDADTVYAAFDNHKMGDFKPYLLKSTDRGRTWSSVAGNLPARGSVYAVALDHVDRSLLFAGTEFGAFFTRDGGASWIQLKGGLPVIAVRDIEIQRRENDVVLATFGRGFYVLDDYTPLRNLEPKALEQPAALFPVDDTWVYVPRDPLGDSGKATQGSGCGRRPRRSSRRTARTPPTPAGTRCARSTRKRRRRSC